MNLGFYMRCPRCGKPMAYIRDPLYPFLNEFGAYISCTNSLCEESKNKRSPFAHFRLYTEKELEMGGRVYVEN